MTSISWEAFPGLVEEHTGRRLGADAPDAIEGLRAYWRLLEAANAEQNLTRITGLEAFLEKHALDALLALPLLPASAPPGVAGPPLLVDVGAGGGVPGIPLALALPGWRVVLVEATRKKVEFLTRAAATLGAGRVEARWARAEDAGRAPDLRAQATAAVARAVGSVPACLELCLPLVAVGGRVLLYRGPDKAESELAEARRVSALLGGGPPEVREASLPGGALRRLIAVTKVGPTPKAYPRRSGLPAKQPL